MSFITNKRPDGLVFLTEDTMAAAGGVLHAFSTRKGGVSRGIYDSLNLGANRGDDPGAVRENYHILCTALGMAEDKLVFSRQVHGDAVRVVTPADGGKGLLRPIDYEADGLITNVPGLPLVIFTADCIPILLYDPVEQAVGAVHAGWRGTALGIVEKAVEKMKTTYGCKPEHILAAIGPGICQSCFETDGDVPAAMKEALGREADPYLRSKGPKFHVDLKGLNALWLHRAGVREISISAHCTHCRPELYWSHRRVGNNRGSQASLIQLL
jgi:YfiH family protein